MAWYSLFVLKVPLNTNQPTNQPTNQARRLRRLKRWFDWDQRWSQQTRIPGLLDDEHRMILRLLVLTHYQRVTD